MIPSILIQVCVREKLEDEVSDVDDEQDNGDPMRDSENVESLGRVVEIGNGEVECGGEEDGDDGDGEEGGVELGGGDAEALLGEAHASGEEAHSEYEDCVGVQKKWKL